ncbi:MAG: ABC transporter ATP-binding protein [Chloroflexi bacterium]|nr:ABC transporter ATP-binding protein [Chloroflexota bacterium]
MKSAIYQPTGFTVIKELSNLRTNTVVPQQTQPPRSLVELRSLTKRFLEGRETRSVIRRADAKIYQGEFVALAGPSGSGKTTLLNLIGGIDTPTDGEVLIDSTRINKLSETERTLFRRKNIGFVFQFFNLIPTLNVRENLLLPLQLNGYASAESERRIRKSLEQVGMADRMDSHPDRLSGGEQQRVAIARALVHDPLLILADEPTGNLDSNTGLVVLSLLQSLIANNGKTLIVVSHSDMVVSAAQRVLAMENGELVERR